MRSFLLLLILAASMHEALCMVTSISSDTTTTRTFPLNVTATAKNVRFELTASAGVLNDLAVTVGTTAGGNDIASPSLLIVYSPFVFGACVLTLIPARTGPTLWFITTSQAPYTSNTVYFTLTATEIYDQQNLINGVNMTIPSEADTNMMHYFDVSDATVPVSLKLVISSQYTLSLNFYILINGCASSLSNTYSAQSLQGHELDLTLTSSSQPALQVGRYSVQVYISSITDQGAGYYYVGSCFGTGCAVTVPPGPWNNSGRTAGVNLYTLVATVLLALAFL